MISSGKACHYSLKLVGDYNVNIVKNICSCVTVSCMKGVVLVVKTPPCHVPECFGERLNPSLADNIGSE